MILFVRIFEVNFLGDFQICNMVLFAIVTMLYITSLWHYITGCLYLLNPFIHSAHPELMLPLAATNLLSMSFVCFFILDPHVSQTYGTYLPLSDLLHSVWHLKVHLCCCKWQDFIFLLLAEQYSSVYIYIPHLYPIIHWRVLRLFSYLGFCRSTCIFLN